MFFKLALFALFSLGFVHAFPSGANGAIALVVLIFAVRNGPMNEICVLSFTPVGNQIQEVQNCTMSMGANVVSSMVFNPATSTSASMSATPTVQAAFSMPGTTLQVITGITIIIVALVTLERVRYRRVFRERRLAEQGAMMGYTGNSIEHKV
ncbi:hypothetical protein EDB19DRAFT_1895779 [Suillus lakei]|nr:hypothetical protein EDB19DRAFT_1895779 [Suillus lakei]